ncbi:MAG: AI-2E family transporter [Chloroflexi bacterium]|nr:AI-2E family transporter [Chloroflexota bacterium]
MEREVEGSLPEKQSETTGRSRRRLMFLVVGALLLLWLAYALRTVLLPFAAALILACLLLPVVRWAENRLPVPERWVQPRRVLLIAALYVVFLAAGALAVLFLFAPIVDAVGMLLFDAPDYIARALQSLQSSAENLRQQFPPELRQQVDRFLLDALLAFSDGLRDAVFRGIALVPGTFSMLLGFVSLPIVLFYLLKDAERLTRSFHSAWPRWAAGDIKNIIVIAGNVLARYVRAQLLLGLIVGVLALIGLTILQVEFALPLAALAGLTELIPILGPWIGGAGAVIVTLATAPEKAFWVALIFLAVQVLENTLLVPRVQGGFMRIHPVLVLLLLVLGSYLLGFWGVFLALPLAALVVEISRYLSKQIPMTNPPLDRGPNKLQ